MPPLTVYKEEPASRELLKTYFITIWYLKKETIYGKKNTREQKLKLFKNSIRERSYFIYNVPKIQ